MTRGGVLVTGASGFLGGRVVRELLEHGHPVVASGRRADALPRGVPHLVGDLSALRDARLDVDAVVHCAALSSPWGRDRDFVSANVDGTAAVIAFARRNVVRRIVHVSSPSVYAATRDRLGIREGDVDHGSRLNAYIRTKLAAEELLRVERERPDAPEVVVLRPRGLVGAGDPSLVPRLLVARERTGIPLFRDGANPTDLTSVQNAARALRLAVERPGLDGEVLHLSNGDPRPFRSLVEQLLRGLGLPLRWRRMRARPAFALAAALEGVCAVLPGRPEPPITRYTVSTLAWAQTLDISRARRMLGWEPSTSVDESLEEYARA